MFNAQTVHNFLIRQQGSDSLNLKTKQGKYTGVYVFQTYDFDVESAVVHLKFSHENPFEDKPSYEEGKCQTYKIFQYGLA